MGLRLTFLNLVITFFFGHGSRGSPSVPWHALRSSTPFFVNKELSHW
jgi:hypothetical protein